MSTQERVSFDTKTLQKTSGMSLHGPQNHQKIVRYHKLSIMDRFDGSVESRAFVN